MYSKMDRFFTFAFGELFALEGAIADTVEAADGGDRVARMMALPALSARTASDASFSRQLRRKFVA